MPMSNKKMGKLHQLTSTGTALGFCQRCPPPWDHVQNSWGFAKMLARNAALLAKMAKMAIRQRTQCRISPDSWAKTSGFWKIHNSPKNGNNCIKFNQGVHFRQCFLIQFTVSRENTFSSLCEGESCFFGQFLDGFWTSWSSAKEIALF